MVNRTPERAAAAAGLAGAVGRVGAPADVAGCRLVVNATPSAWPRPWGCPTGWPLDPPLLAADQVVVDLVYHPRTTPWLDAARARGAVVSNGLGMLVHQAALQLAGGTGLEPPSKPCGGQANELGPEG